MCVSDSVRLTLQVNSAVYIFKNPCLWGRVPQGNSALSPFPASTTYLDRAIAYVAAGDQTWDTYFAKYFIGPTGVIVNPSDPRWNLVGDIPAGNVMPWNRRALFIHGLLRLAAAHGVPGTALYNTSRVAYLERLADFNIRDFLAATTLTTSPNDGCVADSVPC